MFLHRKDGRLLWGWQRNRGKHLSQVEVVYKLRVVSNKRAGEMHALRETRRARNAREAGKFVSRVFWSLLYLAEIWDYLLSRSFETRQIWNCSGGRQGWYQVTISKCLSSFCLSLWGLGSERSWEQVWMSTGWFLGHITRGMPLMHN